MNLNPSSAHYAHLEYIVQPDRLIHRQQFMKAVLPRRANAQPEINFRERWNSDWHGWMIVKVNRRTCHGFAATDLRG